MPKFNGSLDEWHDVADEAQARSNERRKIEEEFEQRLLPYRGFLEWFGLLVVVGFCLLAILCVLYLLGIFQYDPAFSGR